MEQFFVFVGEQWLLVSVLCALVFGYFWTEGSKAGKTLSVHEATRLINGGEALIVDVREAKEFKQGHLVDAINIPHNRINERLSELESSKSKTILLVDKMAQHTGHVGRTLSSKGFDVVRLRGGISEWQAQNLPLVSK
ncbi:MAG: rhodanese-like domain-containing protein [Candidatus Pelagadaptatus aseana]|uniref:rhodanese-like domain-containing protein n=1 Tax=Candidatus Pelagadaptatus aseana TaxID=3120508 RepID=UPI0039B29438